MVPRVVPVPVVRLFFCQVVPEDSPLCFDIRIVLGFVEEDLGEPVPLIHSDEKVVVVLPLGPLSYLVAPPPGLGKPDLHPLGSVVFENAEQGRIPGPQGTLEVPEHVPGPILVAVVGDDVEVPDGVAAYPLHPVIPPAQVGELRTQHEGGGVGCMDRR